MHTESAKVLNKLIESSVKAKVAIIIHMGNLG